MANRRINPRRIRLHLPYTVEQAADALGVHRNMVRQWIRQGLPVADDRRPAIMAGDAIRAFLVARQADRKRQMGAGEIYCFRCREPVRPDGGIADLVPRNECLGTLQGLCPRCGSLMYRSVALSRWQAAVGDLDVTILGGASTPKRDEKPQAQS